MGNSCSTNPDQPECQTLNSIGPIPPKSKRVTGQRASPEVVSSNICRQIKDRIDLFQDTINGMSDSKNVVRNEGYTHAIMADFKLSFIFEGKPRPYTTIFKMQNDDEQKDLILIKNNCITIAISKGDDSYIYNTNEFNLVLSANSGEKGCFHPTLISDRRNKPGTRVNSTDVLQTLMTKLAFCLMPHKDSITIIDIARQHGLSISRFNILRGKPAIYEKYGYQSTHMNKFRDVINRLTWGNLDKSEENGLKDYIGSVLKKEIIVNPGKPLVEPLDTERLTDVMQRISFECELLLSNSEEKQYPSNVIFWNLFKEYLKEYEPEDKEQIFHDIHVYTLNKQGEKWKSWDRKLLFTDFNSDLTVHLFKYKRNDTEQSAGYKPQRRSRRRRLTSNKTNRRRK